MQEPAQVDTDAERKDVELQRYAAAVVEFQVEVRGRLEIDTSVEAVITDEVGAAGGNAGVLIIFAIGGRAAGGAVRGFATTEYAADHGLVSPGRDIIGRDGETELAGVVLQPAVEGGVISEADEGSMEIPSVENAVADRGIEKRREVAEGMVNVIGKIPSSVAGAQPLSGISGGCCQVNRRGEIQKRVWIVQPKIREDVSNADAGGCARIALFRGRGCADEIERNAEVNPEMAREVAANGGSEIVDGAVGTGTAFKPRSQRPPRHEARRAATIRRGGSGIGRLSFQKGAKDQDNNCTDGPMAREHLG